MKKDMICNFCGRIKNINIPDDEYNAYMQGVKIQVAMPSLTADERELFISGMCENCWDEMFTDEVLDVDEEAF